MRRCRICDFPRRYSSYLEWHSDGTVIGSVRPRIPLMFMEVEEWESIFDELTKTIGSPVEHILIEAQKNIGKDLYKMVRAIYWNINVKRVPANRFFRPQFLAKFVTLVMRNDLAGLGAGKPKVVSYRAGDHLTLSFSNPCLVPMVVGNCLGIYESIEEMPGSKAEYRIENGNLIVHMTHSEEIPEAADRLYLEEVEAGSGPVSYERCSKCNVPLKAARSLKWDFKAGAINNPETGKREGMVAVQSMNAILRELVRELGEDVLGILYEAQKRYARERIESEKKFEQKTKEEFWNDYLLELAVRGFGYPSMFELMGDSVSVEMRNAYTQDLYAAKIAAAVEALTGKDSKISWGGRARDLSKYLITVD